MKLIIQSSTIIALLLFFSGAGFAADSDHAGGAEEPAQEETSAASDASEELMVTLQVPLMSHLFSSTPVAVVDEEPITIRDLTDRIASGHAGKHEQATSVKKNYSNLLERIIAVKLMVQEARNIGLDELPAVESQIGKFSEELLISRIMSPQMDAVVADPKEVEKLYKKMSREFLLTALTFPREEDALAFEEEYESRGDFEALARRFVEEGRADGDVGEQQYIKLKDLRPQIAEVAFDMKPASASQIYSAPEGFLLFYIYDARFYEDVEVEEEARRLVRTPLMKERAKEYVDSLLEKYCTIDRALLKKVDFEQKKGGFFSRKKEPADFQELLDDERILATVHEDEPFTVTVGDLAAKLEERHFHGVDKAITKKKLNDEKWPVLRDILFREAARMEAVSQGQDKAEEYVTEVGDYSSSLLFDTFIKKVIAPDVKISEEEVREYYEEHIEEFSSPTMLRMTGLTFSSASDAESALARLRKGADFKWVSANSPGQVDKEAEGASIFDNALLSMTALPEGLRSLVEGARQGDSLLYSAPDGYYHVINIKAVFPSQAQPYQATRGSIAEIIFGQKVKELIDYWSRELREAYETRIFITGVSD